MMSSVPGPASREGSAAASHLISREGWLFDLDGTLLDSSEGVVLAFHTAQRALGEQPALPEAIRRRIGYPLADTLAQLSKLPLESFLTHFRAEALRSMAAHSFLLPGASELLAGLENRDRVLGVVTSKRRDVACAVLDRLSVLFHFRTVVGSECAGRMKPHPEPVLLALDRLGLSREQAVMVGDTKNDVEAARSAGVPVIALSGGIDPASSLGDADLLLAGAPALLDLIESRGPEPKGSLILYTRPECSLCDELKERLKARHLRFRVRDIRESDVWYERYAHAVPVVVASGREFTYPIGNDVLDAWTAQYP